MPKGWQFIDMTGKRFGKLLVVSRSANIGHTVVWKCKCGCGREKLIRGASLRAGVTQSCGCSAHPPTRDLTGQRFGQLIAIKPVDFVRSPCGHATGRWLWRCDCGQEKIIRMGAVTGGSTKSCGHWRTDWKDKVACGQRFGHTVAIRLAGKSSNGRPLWLCRCDCGRNHTSRVERLHNNSCCRHCVSRFNKNGMAGNPAWNVVDIAGQRFGRLTALAPSHKKYYSRTKPKWWWRFRCDCGNECIIEKGNVVAGRQRSCGCLLNEWQQSAECKNNLSRQAKKNMEQYKASSPNYLRREEARRLGEHIFEGTPCGYCGNKFRYVSKRSCIVCQQARHGKTRKSYQKWFRDNRGRINEKKRRLSKKYTDLIQILRSTNPALLRDINSNGRNRRVALIHRVIQRINPRLLVDLGLVPTTKEQAHDTTIGT